MSQLPEALDEVRGKLARYSGKELNEQNTKTALIDPVLRALAWNVGDLEQVQQEYKRKPRDKPVDYALLLLRTPRLFVEAKALGQNLSDRKWANQIMGYATVAGVKWVILTNGDEYRIYNACAEAPVEEKLFRTVSVTDPNTPVEETLALLSKDRISENEIEILWNAHFVDRQIHTVLDSLFSADPDPSFIRLLKKQVGDLSTKDIKASLRRVRAAFDFPVEPTSASRAGSGSGRSGAKRQHSPKMLGVSLKDLIDAGLLKPPLRLSRHYKGDDLEAELLPDGTISFQGMAYKSCSQAASVARSKVAGREIRSTNGWRFWQYRNRDKELVELAASREEFLKRKT